MLNDKLISKILAWKKRWGVVHTFEVPKEPNVDSCFYRSLTSIEAIHIRGLMESTAESKSVDWDSIIVSMALLYPDIKDLKLPGTINIISTNILKSSNPTDESLPDLITESRAWATKAVETNFTLGLCLSICNVFPSINLLSLLELSTDSLIQIASLVEIVAKVQIFQTSSSIKTAPLNSGVAQSLGGKVDGIEQASISLRNAIEKERGKNPTK